MSAEPARCPDCAHPVVYHVTSKYGSICTQAVKHGYRNKREFCSCTTPFTPREGS